MKVGIGNKISLLAIALVLSTTLVVGFILSAGSSKVLVDNEIEGFRSELQLKARDLVSNIDNIRRDVLFLSHSPAVNGILRAHANGGADPESGRSEKAWRDELAALFMARMAVKPDYFQLRLIGMADSGRELVRVDRMDGAIVRIADSELQQKGKRDYFQDTVGLEQGRVYLSKINLNREHGKVSVPYLRTLRVATPVFSADGERFGIAIINVNFGHILDHVTTTSSLGNALYITNSEGDFIANPDPEKTFGFDWGKSYRMQNEMPALARAFSHPRQQELTLDAPNGKGRDLVYLVKAFFDPEQPKRFLAVVQSAPMAIVTADAAHLRRSSFYLAMALATFGAILAFAFSRLLTRPLQQITRAARLVSDGQHNVTLPVERQDEIGVLSRALQQMLTEIKEREQALRGSESRLKATLDTVVDGIVTIDERGLIDAVNPAIEQMFGYSAEELRGQNVSIFMPRPHAEQHDGYIRNYLQTGDRKVIGKIRELAGQHKDGKQFPIHLAVNETLIQGRRLFVGAIQDLTELQRSEERTRRLGEILESSSNEIHTFACPNLRMLESNQTSLGNLGYSQEQLAQMKLFDLFPTSERARIEQALQALDNSDANEQHLDTLFQRMDGSLYPVELRLFASQGKKERVGVLIAEDITERQQQLERLRAYAKRLESSNRELQDFAYVASHDLQEPLRKVQAFGDRLKINESERLSERGQDYIERMQSAAARMQILIIDLLQLSRVTTKGRPFEAVDLKQVALEVMDDLETRLQDVGGQIDIGALPTVNADPLQMRQLLQNLMGNALKFHRPEVSPHVRISAKLEDITTDAPAQYIVTVEDNGIGFDNQYAERIFTPFERLHSRQEYEGTGMGLALCKKIVERHDGTITASGRPGEGTTFTITFPATTEV